MKKTSINPISVILYIVGALLILSAIIVAVRVKILDDQREALKDDFIETQGVIDRIDISAEGGTKIVYAHYVVDGKTYQNVKIHDYPATVKVGDAVSIWYDPENPEKFINNPGTGMVLIENALSIILLVFGFGALITSTGLSKSKAEIQTESKFKPYDAYGGEQTERAGTLFDREIDPAELDMDDKKLKIKL